LRILIILFIGFIGLCGETLYKKGSFVKDISHNLMWQDTKDNTFMLGSQEEAIMYCENLSLGGYKNWELPTKKQYEYIIDNNRKDKLKIQSNKNYEDILSQYTSIKNFFKRV
jgi:formylglycine-generating enzyme required for sulfatase activity